MARYRGVYPAGAGIAIRYQIAGVRRSKFINRAPSESALADASRLRKALIESARLGDPVGREATFSACCAGFLQDKALVLKPSTIDGYKSKLEVYWSDLATLPIRTITLAQIKGIERKVAWRSQKTRREVHAVLKGVFDWAIAEELASDNPAKRLDVGVWARPEIDAFTDAERAAILEQLNGHFRVFYGLMFETGMRTGEVQALKWSDVHKDHIDVVASTYRGELTTPKSHQARRVLLTAAARALLKEQTATRFDPSGFVFLSCRGTPYPTDRPLTFAFKVACRKAVVRYRRPYNCRHTFASRAIMAGMEPSFVAKQMGDRLETVIRHYAKWTGADRDREQINKLK